MAKIKLNPMFEKLRGKFGEIVYRQSYGTLHMSHVPDMTGVVPTTDQMEIRERFTRAAAYGRLVLADPQAAALYRSVAEEKDKPVFALLVADFFNAPVVDELDVSQYDGSVGSPIYVRAHDDFAIKSVRITISEAGGQVLETGEAQIEAGTGQWKYTGTTEIDSESDIRIQVQVSDRPGNVTSKEAAKAV